MNIQTDRAFVPAGTATVRYLTVTITAPAREQRADRPVAHVALVLDRSGSMAGRKIAMAKQAVEHAVRLLDDRDRLALVCYDDKIDTLLSATQATAEAKTLALQQVAEKASNLKFEGRSQKSEVRKSRHNPFHFELLASHF